MNDPAFKLHKPPIIEAILDVDCDMSPGQDLATFAYFGVNRTVISDLFGHRFRNQSGHRFRPQFGQAFRSEFGQFSLSPNWVSEIVRNGR